MEISLKEIYEGWKNVIFANKEVEELATIRLTICTGCEVRTNGVCDKTKGGCGCPLIAKTRSVNSKCPKGFW